MALEDLGEATVPYSDETVDLTNPMAILSIVVSLILGFTLWNMTDSIGANLAARLNSTLGRFLPGGNPAGGSSEGSNI